jgi:hypothetical protein
MGDLTNGRAVEVTQIRVLDEVKLLPVCGLPCLLGKHLGALRMQLAKHIGQDLLNNAVWRIVQINAITPTFL